ncbi:tetratricopeptide repeat protein [Variovorax sp. J22R133]|uniref:tetratricopeptide repeat protein n=1 Tax=Variovorax brevis TaxID=3053503 RepID=UPI0025787552|nr:tetratricopeptide repeat protein [Variovorax sp. J22R133]MDM0117187.1 tetratricopeptide repeat protein [Variovorax sp. J22R133]
MGAILLGACSTPAVRSAADIRAQGYNTQGMDRFKAGDLPRALVSFEQALEVGQSIEDDDAIAATRLNLAMVHLGMGRQDEALKQLDLVMDERRLAFSADRRAEAALRRAMALQASDRESAEKYLDRAGALCGGHCSARGKILNLKSYLALDAGRAEEALRLAQQAQGALDKKDSLERANALRLQSGAYIALKTPAAAVPLLHEALKIDKAAGASEKIYQDLLLLGQASIDEPERAKDYWTRAHDVAVAAKNEAGSRRTAKLLAAPTP